MGVKARFRGLSMTERPRSGTPVRAPYRQQLWIRGGRGRGLPVRGRDRRPVL